MKFNYNLNLGEITFSTNSVTPHHMTKTENAPWTTDAFSKNDALFSMKDIAVSGTVELELMELKEILTNDGLNVDKILKFLKEDLHGVVAANGQAIIDLNNQNKANQRENRISDAEADKRIEEILGNKE